MAKGDIMAEKANEVGVQVECLVLGPIDNNVYLVDDGCACFVVDPSCEPDRIMAALGDRVPAAIVITHGHWDHTGAAAALRGEYGAPVMASTLDAPYVTGEKSFAGSGTSTPCEVDRLLEDHDVLDIGGMRWRVIATPGHTPGGICLFYEPTEEGEGKSEGLPEEAPEKASEKAPEKAPVLISGDTLFAGAHGRVDFPLSNPADMAESLKKLSKLPADTIVLPGHGPATTIGAERAWLKRGGFR